MVNKQILLGRAGKDPEVRHLEGDKVVANFSIATSKKIKDQENTEWHNIVIWGKLAEIVEKYVKKGDLLYVEGETRHRKYESDTGVKYITEVFVNEMKMLGGKKDDDAPVEREERKPQPEPEPEPIGEDDDLPF